MIFGTNIKNSNWKRDTGGANWSRSGRTRRSNWPWAYPYWLEPSRLCSRPLRWLWRQRTSCRTKPSLLCHRWKGAAMARSQSLARVDRFSGAVATVRMHFWNTRRSAGSWRTVLLRVLERFNYISKKMSILVHLQNACLENKNKIIKIQGKVKIPLFVHSRSAWSEKSTKLNTNNTATRFCFISNWFLVLHWWCFEFNWLREPDWFKYDRKKNINLHFLFKNLFPQNRLDCGFTPSSPHHNAYYQLWIKSRKSIQRFRLWSISSTIHRVIGLALNWRSPSANKSGTNKINNRLVLQLQADSLRNDSNFQPISDTSASWFREHPKLKTLSQHFPDFFSQIRLKGPGFGCSQCLCELLPLHSRNGFFYQSFGRKYFVILASSGFHHYSANIREVVVNLWIETGTSEILRSILPQTTKMSCI